MAGGLLASGLLMSYPAALHVTARPAADPVATVVFVHGSLDRGDSFRRVMRRLPDMTAVAYDRRGYQGSRGGGVVGLGGHIEDLLAVMEEARTGGGPAAGSSAGRGRPVVAIGHSLGGDVVMGAALAEPALFDTIAAFEPPMPWLGFRRDVGAGGDAGAARPWPTTAEDPGVEVERFFSRMVGASAWAHLTEAGRERAGRRAGSGGGPAELSERGPAVRRDGARSARGVRDGRSDVAAASPPDGGVAGRQCAQWGRLRDRRLATRGALSRPDHFASMTRVVIERAATG